MSENLKTSRREEVRELLAENEWRKSMRRFDPASGEGAPGERVRVEWECPVLGTGTCLLPKSMLETEVGQGVIESRGVAKFAKERGLSPETVGELFELTRLRHDFPYWASKYGIIRPKRGGENRPLVLNNAQRKLIGEFEAMRTAGLPIRVILLKARQWGGSTVIQLYMVWLQLVGRVGLNSLIVAHQNSATEEIRAMMKRVVDAYPPELMNVDFELAENGIREDRYEGEAQLKSVGRSGNAWHLAARNCDFKIGTAERPDSTRGGSYSLVHLSEVGIWKTTEGKKPSEIVVSATSGVLTEPNTFIALESTAKGKGTYFHREYQAALKGRAQWRPVFVAWYEIEQYALRLDNPEEFAAKLIANRESEDSDERSESGKYLWKLWERGATLEAINWYVWERRKYDCSSAMASEYPSDDDEAFASSGSPVFTPAQLERLSRGVRDGERRSAGRYLTERWAGFEPGREYLAVLQAGASETGRRTTAVVLDVSRPGKPRPVAEMRGPVGYVGAVEAVKGLCREYGECQVAVVTDPSVLAEAGHTGYVVERLKEEWPYIYRPSRTAYVFETDSRSRIAMTDGLAELIDAGRWTEPSREAFAQYETLESDPSVGYRPVPGSSDDLLIVRALGAHIALRQLR